MVDFIVAGATKDPKLTFPVINRLSKSGEAIGDERRCATLPSIRHSRVHFCTHIRLNVLQASDVTHAGVLFVCRMPFESLKSSGSPSCVAS